MRWLIAVLALLAMPVTARAESEPALVSAALRLTITTRDIEAARRSYVEGLGYIPMAKGFVYLVAIVDWFSRKVLAWRVSISMEADFCLEALEEALARYGSCEIFNTDQGSQFTSMAFRNYSELQNSGNNP